MKRIWYKDGTYKDVHAWQAWEYVDDLNFDRVEDLPLTAVENAVKQGFNPVVTGSDYGTDKPK